MWKIRIRRAQDSNKKQQSNCKTLQGLWPNSNIQAPNNLKFQNSYSRRKIEDKQCALASCVHYSQAQDACTPTLPQS